MFIDGKCSDVFSLSVLERDPRVEFQCSISTRCEVNAVFSNKLNLTLFFKKIHELTSLY